MKIIINADDLGLSFEVNKAIETAIIEKRISSCTILANGLAFEDAVRISKQYPYISFGVHLNMIEFCPLTNAKTFEKYHLIDNQGNFIEEAVFVVKEYSKELKIAIYEEWMAQINKIKEAGISISHIDSHQHTHGIFVLKDVLYRVIHDSGITKVRRQVHTSILAMYLSRRNNKYRVRLDKSGAIRKPKKSFIIRRLNQMLNSAKHYYWIKSLKKHASLTDGFVAYGSYIFLFKKYFKWFHFNTLELMCHPGNKAYAYETESLMADEISNCKDYQLISYNEL